MYVYDTRGGCKTLPLDGWLFPCIVCDNITSSHKNDILNKSIINAFSTHIYVPICKSCIRNKKEYILNKKNIKKIS